MTKYALLLLALIGIIQPILAQQDKYLWLEEVDGKAASKFAEAQNKITFEKLSKEKDYQFIYDKSLEILNSTDKIATPSIQGKYVYNFWKDKDHVRGIWRRCLLANYINNKLDWETLLDIDAMSQKDNIKWVFKEASGLYPNYTKFLISLSKGGGDAVVIKEFDADKKEFIENGFTIDEAKGSAGYVDNNTLIVSTDFGEGTLTTSGYSRQVKLWKRGTLLKNAQLIYEGETSDVAASGYVLRDGQQVYISITRVQTFFTSQQLIWKDNKAIKLDIAN